jgi:hypothetical protein
VTQPQDGQPADQRSDGGNLPASLPPDIAALATALSALAERHPEVARRLAGTLTVIAEEACARPRFAARLGAALDSSTRPGGSAAGLTAPRRAARRPAGPWDPYTVHSEGGEQLLRARLAALDLEQLRDMVAEHGMDSDRLAMKWRDPDRVRDRIVERVLDRSVKGDEFRSAGQLHAP